MLLLACGGILSLLNVPVASSAANSIDVKHIAQAAPIDPQSPLWAQAKESEIPLSAQQIYQPGGGGSTRQVKVRALEDGQTFSVRVSWADSTRNDEVGPVPSDMAAVQLPIDPAALPYQCMGQSSSRVNIWQWKAALEKQSRDSGGAVDLDSEGVRNLTSNGICRAVDTPGMQPSARSYWDGAEWHVVFQRAMAKGDYGTAPLQPGGTTSVAFAVWNGAMGETRGMKSVSTWNTLAFEQAQQGSATGLVSLGAVVIISVALIAYAMRRLAD
ncbi:MAG TPA: ethylbenzene dehydrogenase-related protein [Chloroflexota bacterium]